MTEDVLITSDGEQLALRDFGGSGPPVLLVHGAGLCASMLAPLAGALRSVGHAIAPDLRGHGRSPRPPDGDFGWLRIATDLTELLDAIDEPVFAFGHSLGATALLLAARLRPGAIRALCCFEPIALGARSARVDIGPVIERAERRRSAYASNEEATAHFGARPPFSALAPGVLAAYVADGLRDGPDGDRVLSLAPTDEANVYRAALDPDLDGALDDLANLDATLTVLCGGAGNVVSELGARRLFETVPGCRLVAIPGLDHFGPFAAPGLVAAATITAFETPTA